MNQTLARNPLLIHARHKNVGFSTLRVVVPGNRKAIVVDPDGDEPQLTDTLHWFYPDAWLTRDGNLLCCKCAADEILSNIFTNDVQSTLYPVRDGDSIESESDDLCCEDCNKIVVNHWSDEDRPEDQ